MLGWTTTRLHLLRLLPAYYMHAVLEKRYKKKFTLIWTSATLGRTRWAEWKLVWLEALQPCYAHSQIPVSPCTHWRLKELPWSVPSLPHLAHTLEKESGLIHTHTHWVPKTASLGHLCGVVWQLRPVASTPTFASCACVVDPAGVIAERPVPWRPRQWDGGE